MIFTQMRRASTFCFILGLRKKELLSLMPEDVSEDGTSVFVKCDVMRQISVPPNYVKEIKDTRDLAIRKQKSKLFD
jgi:hypothetical protein